MTEENKWASEMWANIFDVIVNRVEVIDLTEGGEGRSFVKWEDHDFEVNFDLQDNACTLKIFVTDIKEKNK